MATQIAAIPLDTVDVIEKRLLDEDDLLNNLTDEKTTLRDLIEGLVLRGGTPNIKDYVYAGGNEGAACAYFEARYMGRRAMPVHEPGCVCTHKIKQNFYIEHKMSKGLFVIGSECIKRWLGTVERTCTFCGGAHRNRKDNMCKLCRKTRVFINVPRDEKEEAKRMGACWNPSAMHWWVNKRDKAAIARFGRVDVGVL